MKKKFLANILDAKHPHLTTPLVVKSDSEPNQEELAIIIAVIHELEKSPESEWQNEAKLEILRDYEK